MSILTAQTLRDIVEEVISPTITMHRHSRLDRENDYTPPESQRPTDEEIDSFLFSNPLLDYETVTHLTEPGLLGFPANTAKASDDWISEFRRQVQEWANTNEWSAADLVYYHLGNMLELGNPEQEIWKPGTPLPLTQAFLAASPSHLLLADRLLREGRLLSELGWRDFEHLIAELLESHGWAVTLMQGSKDGGIDVIATREDSVLGSLQALWQAKKYSSDKKVQLRHLRELSAVLERSRATKGIIVTTSSLTRGAIDWVSKDTYRVDAKDGKYVEHWVRQRLYEI